MGLSLMLWNHLDWITVHLQQAMFLCFHFIQIDEDSSLVPEAIQGGTYGFNSANVPAEGFQF